MTGTYGSLFTGIGGLDLGVEAAGWEPRWQVEQDYWCKQILARHWPTIPRYDDAWTVTDLEPVDLVVGGFPCQPVSVAGRKLAQADPRWLWPAFARILDEVRPAYALIENVPGLLRAGMRDVLADLARLGFDAEWSTVSACALGAPHTRSRLFIVAYAQRSRTTTEARTGSGRNGSAAEARTCARR